MGSNQQGHWGENAFIRGNRDVVWGLIQVSTRNKGCVETEEHKETDVRHMLTRRQMWWFWGVVPGKGVTFNIGETEVSTNLTGSRPFFDYAGVSTPCSSKIYSHGVRTLASGSGRKAELIRSQLHGE